MRWPEIKKFVLRFKYNSPILPYGNGYVIVALRLIYHDEISGTIISKAAGISSAFTPLVLPKYSPST